MGRLSRYTWLGFVLLCLLAGLGYAHYDYYLMDGDSVSFMDIADGIRSHHAALALNSYWNPLYPTFLAAAQVIAHPSRWMELRVYAYVNFLIFAACIGATVYMVDGLVQLQRRGNVDGPEIAAVPPQALRYAAVALLLYSFERELRIGFMRSDSLLLLFLLLAAGILVRLQAGGRMWRYAVLGLALGLAYLTKSFAFLPSAILFLALFLFGLTRTGPARRRITLGAVLAGAVFTAVAGPYIAGISRQMGHLTTGESARLNYAFFIDDTPRWHQEAQNGLGHAGGVLAHPEIVLLESPPVSSFRNHPVGTFPLWFDPAYFMAGIKPHFYLPGHVRRLVRDLQLLVRWLVNHPEGLLLLAILLASGATLRRRGRESWPWLVLPAWGLLMLGIYFPIDLQERYLTAVLLFLIVPLLAMLRSRSSRSVVTLANGASVLLAGLALMSAFQDVANMRRQLSLQGRTHGFNSPEIFGAARGLAAMGLKPGDAVGCMGGQACIYDPYWARLAGVQILSEIEVPDATPPIVAWNSFTNKPEILSALRSQGIRALVTAMPGVSDIPAGWHPLDGTIFVAYPLEAAELPPAAEPHR